MKKYLVLSLLTMFVFCGFASARNVYDSTGRTVVKDNTLRGQKRAAVAKAQEKRKLEAAAAAKLDYEEFLKTLEEPKPKPNFYQDRIKK